MKSVHKENLKIELTGILVGVVLVVLMGVMSDFFDTAPFFGMAIMLLSLILVKVSFLVGSVQKQKLKSDLEDPGNTGSNVPSRG